MDERFARHSTSPSRRPPHTIVEGNKGHTSPNCGATHTTDKTCWTLTTVAMRFPSFTLTTSSPRWTPRQSTQAVPEGRA